MRNPRRWWPLWAMFMTLATSGILPSAALAQLRIVHIDVGQGDATLIVGPQRSLLFDAGKTGSGAAVKAALTAQGLKSIDFFIAGHYHEDHIGGIDELLSSGVTLNAASYDRGGSYSSQSFTDYVRAVGSRRKTITLNQQIDLGGGCVVTCLAVNGKTNHGTARMTGENDRSVAIVLRYGTFDYFIASDLTGGGTTGGQTTADVESLVAPDVGDVDVLHVGHHGSNTSTNQNLVDTLEPEQAVISCGDGNSHGHPTQEVLDRLTAAPSIQAIWQTERGAGGFSPKVRVGGDILFQTDGTAYTVTLGRTGETFSYRTDDASEDVGVVINEIAWMGSASSAYDEWIELFNPGGMAADLTGWRIVDDGGAQVYLLDGSIQAGGYYLIERSVGSTSVAGDLVVSLNLANTGDSLLLLDEAGAAVDVVNRAGGAWYAGNSTGRYTMERVDPLESGDDASNWASNDGVTRNGLDSGGRVINGTPRAMNSAAR